MSLDVYLQMEYPDQPCKACGGSGHYTDNVFSRNITHNLNKMAMKAGVYKALWRPEEIGITRAGQLVDPLSKGLNVLIKNPEKFKKLNPINGWGSYDGLLAFIEAYLEACKNYPDAYIEVSR